ncbi:preprotein translocase subunit SecG [bacterium]|nr:MAG: preprotein translocase subunit SecG [bacterium]
MLIVLLKILHIIVAVFLILVVLLQTGKGAEMGAAFGGASQTVFGGSGPAGFMAKLTTTAAVVFMLTSLSLAYVSSGRSKGTIAPEVQVPVEAPDQAGQPVPTEQTEQTEAPLTDTEPAEPGSESDPASDQ